MGETTDGAAMSRGHRHHLKQLAGRLTKWHKEFGVGETTDGAAMSRGHRHHAAEHEDDQEQVIPLLLLCPSLTIL